MYITRVSDIEKDIKEALKHIHAAEGEIYELEEISDKVKRQLQGKNPEFVYDKSKVCSSYFNESLNGE